MFVERDVDQRHDIETGEPKHPCENREAFFASMAAERRHWLKKRRTQLGLVNRTGKERFWPDHDSGLAWSEE